MKIRIIFYGDGWSAYIGLYALGPTLGTETWIDRVKGWKLEASSIAKGGMWARRGSEETEGRSDSGQKQEGADGYSIEKSTQACGKLAWRIQRRLYVSRHEPSEVEEIQRKAVVEIEAKSSATEKRSRTSIRLWTFLSTFPLSISNYEIC